MARIWSAPKDPDEVKDYTLDWAPLLEDDDTLVTSEWSVDSEEDGDTPLTIDSDSNTDTLAIVWLSGGNIGTSYLLNRVTTVGGRTYDQTMKLNVKVK
jgi:hypothetical protein